MFTPSSRPAQPDLAATARRRLAALAAPTDTAPDATGSPDGGPGRPAPGPGRHARPAEPEPDAPAPRAPRANLAAWLPAGLQEATARLTGRAVVGLALLALLAAALGASYWSRSRPRVVPAPPVAARTSAPATPPSGAPSAGAPSAGPAGHGPGAPVVVHVAGLVRRPGVVELRRGARVTDAIAAAGGPRRGADLGRLNLARPLTDGEQVLVAEEGTATAAAPGRAPAGASPGGTAGASAGGTPGGGGSATTGGPLDLNAATLEQLQQLPGVGPVLAQRILDWRQQHGRFSSVEELQEVNGIGEGRYADLAPRVRV